MVFQGYLGHAKIGRYGLEDPKTRLVLRRVTWGGSKNRGRSTGVGNLHKIFILSKRLRWKFLAGLGRYCVMVVDGWKVGVVNDSILGIR